MIARVAAGLAALASPATACELALVLALDVSSSVDAAEYALQRDGLAAALQAPEVMQAILGQGPGQVYLSVYEWSGRNQMAEVLPWVALDSRAAITASAGVIAAARRSHNNFPTAIGYALGHGALLLDRGPACHRRVIDISGDGVLNDGFAPRHAYRHFPFEGVTVNGLAVLGADPDVERYYLTEVIRGPGAFVEVAEGYPGFADAMRRKLFREINGLVVGARDPF